MSKRAGIVVARDNPDGPAVLDPATIAELREEGSEFLAEVVDAFKAELPKQLSDLAQALAKGETNAAARIAHNVKGVAATLGANRMWAQASAIDQTLRTGSIKNATAMLEQFSSECDRVRAALEKEVSKIARD